MTKKRARILALMMLLLAVAFFLFALCHPEASFPWSNQITYATYVTYLVAMFILFAAPFSNR